MKTKEKEALKNKTVAELNEELAKAQEKKFNLLFKHSTTPIANPMEIRAVRREIALLQTLINQKKSRNKRLRHGKPRNPRPEKGPYR